MVIIENASDFEFYSANSAGGFQGNGYQCRNAGYAPTIRSSWLSAEMVKCTHTALALSVLSPPRAGPSMTSSSLTVRYSIPLVLTPLTAHDL